VDRDYLYSIHLSKFAKGENMARRQNLCYLLIFKIAVIKRIIAVAKLTSAVKSPFAQKCDSHFISLSIMCYNTTTFRNFSALNAYFSDILAVVK